MYAVAGRRLLKTPGVTIGEVLTLALGIGASTAVFAVGRACGSVRCHFPTPIASPSPPAEGTTIIQVTHSETNATYGNRVIRLKDGWLAAAS